VDLAAVGQFCNNGAAPLRSRTNFSLEVEPMDKGMVYIFLAVSL